LRDGKPGDATVTVGDRDKVFAELTGRPQQNAPDNSSDAGEKLGLVVRQITDQMASRIHTSGVIVQSVRTGSFADLQGLEPGLVITRINKHPTGTKDQFDAVVKSLKTGDDVVFEVMDPHHPENGITYVGGTL
jgi:serine protease Do